LLVACGCYLGLRVEEIIMLRWEHLSLDDVDPKTGEPRPVCHITPHSGWQPKDGEARDIPICAPLLAILKQHRQAEGYLLTNEPGRSTKPRTGKGWLYRYDPKKVWLRVMKAVVAAGGKAITMYGMRHSFASNYLIAGVSDVKVSRWLGHADTRMVHRHYGHLLSYDGDINAVHRPKG
jgi:integrase